jgi:hypothetical protein
MPRTESPRSSIDRFIVVLDSESHINAGAQRPAQPVRWSGLFGDPLLLDHLINPE